MAAKNSTVSRAEIEEGGNRRGGNATGSGAAVEEDSNRDSDGTFSLTLSHEALRSMAGAFNGQGLNQEALTDLISTLVVTGRSLPKEDKKGAKEWAASLFEAIDIPPNGPVQCITFDLKSYMSKIPSGGRRRSGRPGVSFVNQDIVTMASEPDRPYLGHVVPKSKDPRGVANGIWSFLESNDMTQIDVLIGDSKPDNLDPERGIFHLLQEKKGHRLVVGVCKMSSNEAALRRLIAQKRGDDSLGGGSMLGKSLSARYLDRLRYDRGFKKIKDDRVPLPDFEELQSKSGMTEEEDYGYKMVAVIAGHEFAARDRQKGGFEDWNSYTEPMIRLHRPTTLGFLDVANGYLRLYVCRHGLTGRDLADLTEIVTHIVLCFYPMHFAIKLSPRLLDGPLHVFKEVEIVRSVLPESTRRVVHEAIEEDAWMAHPEILLLHLLANREKRLRQFAVDKILALRGDAEFGDMANRPLRVPKLNWRAENIENLIHWDRDLVTEPILTAKLSKEDLKGFVETPMAMRKFPCHAYCMDKVEHHMSYAAEENSRPEDRDVYMHGRLDPAIIVAKDEEDTPEFPF